VFPVEHPPKEIPMPTEKRLSILNFTLYGDLIFVDQPTGDGAVVCVYQCCTDGPRRLWKIPNGYKPSAAVFTDEPHEENYNVSEVKTADVRGFCLMLHKDGGRMRYLQHEDVLLKWWRDNGRLPYCYLEVAQ
jgi:hypothetical protein